MKHITIPEALTMICGVANNVKPVVPDVKLSDHLIMFSAGKEEVLINLLPISI
jgi:hypothetical protein